MLTGRSDEEDDDLDDDADAPHTPNSARSWWDRLSSYSGGSLSTHGRGTVASAVDTEADADSEDDWGDGDESSSTSSSDDDGEGAAAALLVTGPRGGGGGSSRFCSRQVWCSWSGWAFLLRRCAALFCCCIWERLPPAWGGPAVVDRDGKPLRRPKRRAYSLGIFAPTHPLRRACIHLILHPWFERTVLAVILLSSVSLAVDSPLNDPASTLVTVLRVLDIMWAVFFTAETTAKVVANGLLSTEQAYLKSGWNVLDVIVVAVSIFSLATDGNVAYRSLRSLRALRALRPLRVISRNPSLRLVVNALFRALGPIINVMLVSSLMYLVFAIVTTGLFKGATSECTGPVVDIFTAGQTALLTYPVPYAALPAAARAWGVGCTSGPGINASTPGSYFTASGNASYPCPAGYGYGGGVADSVTPTSRVVCAWFGGVWQRRLPQSFDDVVSAMGVLLEMSTTEQWVDVLYKTMDARGADMQPVRDANFGAAAVWVAFIMFGAYFTVNLFVAAIVDEFERSREQLGESYLLTDAQKEWVRAQEVLLLVRPKRRVRPPTDPLRRSLFWVVTGGAFEQFIMVCIVGNTVALAVPYFGMPQGLNTALDHLNNAFAALFTLEAAAKIYAMGWATYWSDTSWNRFDFGVVVASDVGILVSLLSTVQIGALGTLVRMLRIARVARIVRGLTSLRQMISTLLITIPSLINIGSLLLLVLFIYAVAGVQLFAQVRYGDATDRHANFRNVGTAMLTLWRALTGEAWNSIMYDLTVSDGCNPDPPWNEEFPTGCGSSFALTYFYTYIIINAFTVVQLLIAVVLEAFSDIADVRTAVWGWGRGCRGVSWCVVLRWVCRHPCACRQHPPCRKTRNA